MEVQPTSQLPVAFRPMRPSDESLVWDSWLKSFRQSGSSSKLPSRIYFRNYRSLFEELVARDDTGVLMAVSPRDSDRVYGWLCMSDTFLPRWSCVHYGYIKGFFRRQGVMRALCGYAGIGPDSRVIFTLSTRRVRGLVRKAEAAEYLALEEFLKS